MFLFFNSIGIGYHIRRVPRRGHIRRVDYEYGDVGVEVTSVRDYLPRSEVDKLLARQQMNYRICAYMYLKDDKPKIEIINEQKLVCYYINVSILCLQQHVSCSRAKIIDKIDDKYSQNESHPILIIMMDFRLAHFDLLSLKGEIKSILASIGMDLPSLGGILVSTPKRLNSDLFSNECDYVFVNNTYSNHNMI